MKKEKNILCFVPRGTAVKGYLHPQNFVQKDIDKRESGTDGLILAVCIERFNKLLGFKPHAMKPYVPLCHFNDFFRTFLYGFEFKGDKSNDKTFVKIKEGVYRKKCYTRYMQAALQRHGIVSEEITMLKNFTKELYDFVDRQSCFLDLFYTSDRILHYSFLFRNYTLKDGNNTIDLNESSNEFKMNNKSVMKTMYPRAFVKQRQKKLNDFKKNFKDQETLGKHMNEVKKILDNKIISVGTILYWLDDDQKKSLYDKLGMLFAKNSQTTISDINVTDLSSEDQETGTSDINVTDLPNEKKNSSNTSFADVLSSSVLHKDERSNSRQSWADQMEDYHDSGCDCYSDDGI